MTWWCSWFLSIVITCIIEYPCKDVFGPIGWSSRKEKAWVARSDWLDEKVHEFLSNYLIVFKFKTNHHRWYLGFVFSNFLFFLWLLLFSFIFRFFNWLEKISNQVALFDRILYYLSLLSFFVSERLKWSSERLNWALDMQNNGQFSHISLWTLKLDPSQLMFGIWNGPVIFC
jgi:hypothetical protein